MFRINIKIYNSSLFLFLICLTGSMAGFSSLEAKGPVLSAAELSSPPPKIIRTCCSFGSYVKVAAFPLKKITNITSIELLGPHRYLGHKSEKNGIIYTRKGGFIDLGHTRDMADWTGYLYTLIQANKGNKAFQQKLGHEGGKKLLQLLVPENITQEDAVLIAGSITYDLSVWHEIATWFGSSFVPLIPERYSSFSVEDIYSNLLGVHLGMEAIKSDLPFEEAITVLLKQKLNDLAAVKTAEDTFTAMEAVEGDWWTRNKALPSSKILMKRYLDINDCINPWLVSGFSGDYSPVSLCVPSTTKDGKNLKDYYRLNIKLNQKFPFKKIFPLHSSRNITSQDYTILMLWIKKEIFRQEVVVRKKLNIFKRKRYWKKQHPAKSGKYFSTNNAVIA